MDAWLLALRDFGRLRFEDVVQQALYYAEDGFAVSEVLREDIIEYYDGFQGWPANASTFTPSGKIPNAGDILKQPQLSRQSSTACGGGTTSDSARPRGRHKFCARLLLSRADG